MSRILHRNRTFLAAFVLASWVFALCVGIANACSWDGVSAPSHQLAAAARAVGGAMDDGASPGCEEFCSNDIPLVGVLQMVVGQPGGQPFAVATYDSLRVLPISAPVRRFARTAHPSLRVPFSLRTVRLTL